VKPQSPDPASILPEPDAETITGTDQSEAIAVLSRDLFFGMRIRTALKQLGYSMMLVKDEASFVSALEDPSSVPVLGLLDFNQPVDWEAVSRLAGGAVPVVAFGSHTDIEGFRSARAAGVTRVTSNGDFSRSLPDLIAKYRREPGDHS